VLLMEPEGSSYWAAWKQFVDAHLLQQGFISREDSSLFRLVRSADEGVRLIEQFYRVYHSIRYVRELTVFRLNRAVSNETLRLVNKEFRDILTDGEIVPSGPIQEEIEKGEFPDLPRLVMKFNRHDYGRLVDLIDHINNDGLPGSHG
jgi:hypothetical protein